MSERSHELKLNDEFCMAIATGKKTWEIRKNDRDFQVGDKIVLRGFSNGEYTGRELIVVITYILGNVPHYGLSEEYVCMSIVVITYNF